MKVKSLAEMKDHELLAHGERWANIYTKRKNILTDPITVERLKQRKIAVSTLIGHVNPIYKETMQAINEELVKRKLV